MSFPTFLLRRVPLAVAVQGHQSVRSYPSFALSFARLSFIARLCDSIFVGFGRESDGLFTVDWLRVINDTMGV